MQPLVSILIPCYNAERWIDRAIESALAQTWESKEIIVVDDGSTDGSLSIVRRYEDRIRWQTGPNGGSNIARNLLLEMAKGDWLQYLDADDYLLPGKVAEQMMFALSNPDCDIVYGPVAWKRVEKGTVVCSETPIPGPRDPWILLASWALPQTGGVLWKRAVLQQAGGWRIGQPCCQEHELYCRLLVYGARFGYCDGCFAVYCDFDEPGRITRNSYGEYERQRLLILDRMESYLVETSQLTQVRRQAINDARHVLARRIWGRDPKVAVDVYRRILSSDERFVPSLGAASPTLYLAALRILGFGAAQQAASWTRFLRRQ